MQVLLAVSDSGTRILLTEVLEEFGKAQKIQLTTTQARHAEEARAFIDWVGSEDALLLAAEQAFRLPARTDLARERLPQWARDALDQIVTAEVDWQLIAERGRGWMARWDREVRGKG